MYIKAVCGFCKQPINFACGRCGYITDEKVHLDCINAEFPSINYKSMTI